MSELCFIQNHFEDTIESIRVPKSLLLTNFDYFKSLDKYEPQVEITLDLNLDHEILKFCLNLLEENKLDESNINLEGCVAYFNLATSIRETNRFRCYLPLLSCCCALLCNNMDIFSSIIRVLVNEVDVLFKNQQSNIPSKVLDQLHTNSIYPNLKDILTNRIICLTNPNVMTDKIIHDNNFLKENTVVLVLLPRSFNNDIRSIGPQPNSYNTIETAHTNLRFSSKIIINDLKLEVNIKLRIVLDTKKNNMAKQKITFVLQRFVGRYSDNVCQEYINKYGSESFGKGGEEEGRFGYNIGLDFADMCVVCINTQ